MVIVSPIGSVFDQQGEISRQDWEGKDSLYKTEEYLEPKFPQSLNPTKLKLICFTKNIFTIMLKNTFHSIFRMMLSLSNTSGYAAAWRNSRILNKWQLVLWVIPRQCQPERLPK